jgi:hypothetical protein
MGSYSGAARPVIYYFSFQKSSVELTAAAPRRLRGTDT